MRWPWAESLFRRVTLVTALSSAGGGLAAAVAATWAANRAVDQAEDRRLVDQAKAMLDELAKVDPKDVQREVEEEALELAPLGLRLAVFERGVFVGGDRSLVAEGGCRTLDVHGRAHRSCTEVRDARTCVVTLVRVVERRWLAYVWAALFALGTAAALGLLASRATATWALGPLARLRERVGRGDDLGSDEGVAEVDALRASLVQAFHRSAIATATAQRFAADAAHELRTPLTAISGELELLRGESRREELVGGLGRIHTSVRGLSHLVERLLILASAGEGVAVRDGDAVELGDLLGQLGGADVSCEGEGIVRGDEALILAMLENAVQNALVHGRPPVVVRVRQHDAEVTIDVVDEGPGVRDGDHERLFHPFVRAAGVRQQGFGLGLSLIAQVARVHGGSAAFVPRARGAHLRIVLPAWRPQVA